MALSTETRNQLAKALYDAEQNREPIPPLSETNPEIDMEDAYAIQLEGIRLRTGGDASKIIGWKVGLTSKAVQNMLGVDQPDFGHLLDHTRIDEGAEIKTGEMIWSRIEPEIAFELNADLKGPGVTADDVMKATAYLIPALEVVDSRVKDWKIKIWDTVADNASCGRFVLGKSRVKPDGINMKLIGMNFYVDGNLTSTATSAAVIGNPADAVAWLANTLAPYGHYL
ncbi:MAG: 2-keto-4-pentenoate hydratase, partial [Dehalococcoidia bacterium]